MGKVEIKIRKKILTPDNLERYRNYPALLKKYERTKRFKRALRIFLYSLVLTIFVLGLIFISMWKVLSDKQEETKSVGKVYTYSRERLNGRVETLTRTHIQTAITETAHTVSFHRNKIDTTQISFPINSTYNSDSIFWLSEKIFTTKAGDFLVTKYLLDEKNAYDEETMYFYSTEYGILLEKYVAWGVDTKLIKTGDAKSDQKIHELISAIESDSIFYHEIKPPDLLK